MSGRGVCDDETEFAFWKSEKEAEASAPRRVLIGHKDRPIGESLRVLVTTNGYETLYAEDMAAVNVYLKCWKPHAILIDTRLDAASDYAFVRAIRAEPSTAHLLVLAMSNIWPLDSISALKKAGFDGHCRRPCSLWRIADLLDSYFCLSDEAMRGRNVRSLRAQLRR